MCDEQFAKAAFKRTTTPHRRTAGNQEDNVLGHQLEHRIHVAIGRCAMPIRNEIANGLFIRSHGDLLNMDVWHLNSRERRRARVAPGSAGRHSETLTARDQTMGRKALFPAADHACSCIQSSGADKLGVPDLVSCHDGDFAGLSIEPMSPSDSGCAIR